MEPTNDQRQPPIDNSPAAQQARAIDTADEAIHDIAARAAGGAGNRDALLQWAGANLSADEIRQFNIALSSPDTVSQAVENLRNLHAAATRQQASAGGPGAGHSDPQAFSEAVRRFEDSGFQDQSALAEIEATPLSVIQRRSM